MVKKTIKYLYILTFFINTSCNSNINQNIIEKEKMVEILIDFNLLDNYGYNKIKTAHIAEGPGGFIEALVNKRMFISSEASCDKFILAKLEKRYFN